MATGATHGSVLLIGASRGLGLAIAAEYVARGARVLATVRGSGRTALHELREQSGGLLEIQESVDVTVPGQVRALRRRLEGCSFELLLVNAGIATDSDPADITSEEFNRVMTTNALGPLRAIELLGDLVGADGTIAVMSSGQGSVANNSRGGFDVYRASKSALNQLVRSYAARHGDDPRTLLLLAPGWVRTGLGGPHAPLSIEETIPQLVTTVDNQRGHGGLQYLDRFGGVVPW